MSEYTIYLTGQSLDCTVEEYLKKKGTMIDLFSATSRVSQFNRMSALKYHALPTNIRRLISNARSDDIVRHVYEAMNYREDRPTTEYMIR